MWLKPNSDWRRTYASWPAWEKLRFVDEIMHDIVDQPTLVRSRAQFEALRDNRRTLAQHYHDKLARLSDWRSEAADGLLLRVFARQPRRRGAARAASFLRSHRRELLVGAQRQSDADSYTLHQVLRLAIDVPTTCSCICGVRSAMHCRMRAGCLAAWCGCWVNGNGHN